MVSQGASPVDVALLDAAADRALARPEALGQSGGHHHVRRIDAEIGRAERAAVDQVQPERLDVAGRDAMQVGARPIGRVYFAHAFGGIEDRAAATERRIARQTRVGHAGQPAQIVEHGERLHPAARFRGRRARRRRRKGRQSHGHDDHAVRIETRIELRERGEAAREQRRADQQRDRHRDLTRDDHLHHPAAATAARFDRAFAQILRERVPPHRRERRQTDHHRDQHAEAQHERERAPVEPRRREAGQLHRAEREQRITRPQRQQRARRAAKQHDPRAFCEHQAHQAELVGADRAPQRELAPPRFGARQQQARHARTRDHQHERHCAKQQRDGGPHVAEHFGGERRHFNAALVVGFGIRLLELPGHGGHVGLRRLDIDAGTERRDARGSRGCRDSAWHWVGRRSSTPTPRWCPIGP